MRHPWVLVLAACGGSPAPSPSLPNTPVEPASPIVEPPAKPPAKAGPPVAARRPTTQTYHGVKVEDPYQWLEADTDEVKAWSDGQNAVARKALDAYPNLPQLREEIRAFVAAPVTRYWAFQPAAGKVFAMRKLPDKEQPDIVVMDSPEAAGSAKLVLDPTAGRDKLTAIDWYEVSPDGTKLAVSLSSGGSESGDLHIVGLDGKDLEPAIPNVQRGTGGGDVAWRNDSKGLWYTRYPAKGEKPDDERDFWMQLWFHELGGKDRYELGKDLPKIAEVRVACDSRGRVITSVQNGDGGTFRHYLRDTKGTWRQLTDWDDHVTSLSFGPGTDLWGVSIKDAPHGKVFKLADTANLAAAKVVVPEGADSIVTDFFEDKGPLVTANRIYVGYQVGGPSTIRAFDLTGKSVKGPPVPDVATVGYANHTIGKDLLVFATTYVMQPAWFRYSEATNKLVEVAALSPKVPIALDDFEVYRELATSKDGTKVPLNIIWKKGAPKDGSVPCVVNGYGGYGNSESPNYMGGWAHMMKRGVCWVSVNLRGGGEFGEDWHKAGMLTNKQNVFDDFSAALAHIAKAKYSRPDRIVIIGGSNGGLLMGAQLTQHPDQMKAVVAAVGIFDMLRVELSPNGLYNTTEFGTVKDEAQFKALYAYSPYHHVKPNASYPPVLFVTGANDPRVSPWQSRKMVAALQHAQPDGTFLLRTSTTAGHGMGTAMSERIDTGADISAFILSQLGIR